MYIVHAELCACPREPLEAAQDSFSVVQAWEFEYCDLVIYIMPKAQTTVEI